MPVIAEQGLNDRTHRLARAKALSDIVTKESIRVGITTRELEESASRALVNLKGTVEIPKNNAPSYPG